MLKEIIEEIITRKRPEHTDVIRYGNYDTTCTEQATYSDSKKEYITRHHCPEEYSVKSKDAFIAYIKEELKRRNNKNGAYSTVHITTDGGSFTADCHFDRGLCTYTRLHSEQYNILENYKDKVLDHEEFLTMIQKLKPSIDNFAELYQRCSKIRVVGRSQMTSQPIYDDEGNAEASFICTYKLEDGTDEDVTLPADFFVKVPFVKAGKNEYTYHVELLFYNTKSNSVAVKVQIPEWETTEERAIIEEASEIKEALNEKTELLVLADF